METRHPCRDCQALTAYFPGECCADCHNARVRAHRAARKLQLAALARCEGPGCARRATYRARGIGCCGLHLRQIKAGHANFMAGLGELAIIGWLDGAGQTGDTFRSYLTPLGKE